MNVIVRLFLGFLAVAIAAYLLEGIRFASLQALVVTAVILGLINTFLKPLLKILLFPLNLLTFGLFGLLVNALIILTLPYFIPGFVVQTFFSALLFSLILSLITLFFSVGQCRS